MDKKIPQQTIKFDAFMKDKNLTYTEGATEYHGDPKNQVIVEIDNVTNFIDITTKGFNGNLVFQNVLFKAVWNIMSTKFEILAKHTTFKKCKFDVNTVFVTKATDVLYLDNCKSGNYRHEICGGNVFVSKCNFTESNIVFNSCTGVNGSDSYFFRITLSNFGGSHATFTNCRVSTDLNISKSQFDIFGFYGGKVKDIWIATCHFNSLAISDYTGTMKPVKLETEQITIRNSFIYNASFLAESIKNIIAKVSIISRSVLYTKKIPNISSTRSTGFIPTQKHLTLYKKALVLNRNSRVRVEPVIVKLEVPDDAKRVYCDSGKIRVSKATTADFYNLNGKQYNLKPDRMVVAGYGGAWYEYEIGKNQKPDRKFDPEFGKCGSGIHGFESFQEAVDYIL